MHYLDHAATTPVSAAALAAATQTMRDCFGNPSSLHALGRTAAHQLEACRATVAQALGASPEEIYFTSCATESTNLALRGVMWQNRHHQGQLLTSRLEHAATLQTAHALAERGASVTYLHSDASGHIVPGTLAPALESACTLLSCQLVNNEIGTVQPVEALGAALKARHPRALFHIDAVQGLCRLPLTPQKWHCDLMSVSGHKIGAPKGIGALYIKKGVRLPALMTGGGQERGLRPGTESLPLIAAFAAACAEGVAQRTQNYAYVEQLAAYLHERATEQPYLRFVLASDVPHIQSMVVEGCKSEVLLRMLSDAHVYVSAGSACAKGKQSGVLSAVGLARALSDCTLRISLSHTNTREDIDALLAAVREGAARLRR